MHLLNAADPLIVVTDYPFDDGLSHGLSSMLGTVQ